MTKYILYIGPMASCCLTLLLLAIFCTLDAQAKNISEEEQNPYNDTKVDVSYVPDMKPHIGVVYRINETKNENVMKTVEWLGHKINISNPLRDVRKAYRSVVPKLDIRPIVIHFVNSSARQKWLDAYVKVPFQYEPWKPNFKDDWWWLTCLVNAVPLIQEETQEWAKAKNYFKVWSHNQTVFYRKHPKSPMYKIKHIEHLHYLHNETLEPKIEITESPHGHLDENQEEITDPPP